MAIRKDVLLAALSQLTAKYRGRGVDHITVQMLPSGPVFIMHGPTANPPNGLPGRMTVPDDIGRAVALPVMWRERKAVPLAVPGTKPVRRDGAASSLPMSPDRPVVKAAKPDEIDVERGMWHGYTPIDRRDVVTEYQPGSDHIATQEKIPDPTHDELRISVDITGKYGWWTKPFDVQGCLCCTFYATPVAVLTYTSPEDWWLIVDSWSFFVYGNFFIGETFNVRFVRDGETILEYDEVIVDPANPDPAKRCLFSGSTEQVMQNYIRIDRNQTLVVYITPKGLFPFPNGPADPFCGTICCLLHGHRIAMLDNRDGAPRPVDVGALRDNIDCTGLIEQVSAEDLEQLYAWMDGASADAIMPDVPQHDVSPSQTASPVVSADVPKPATTTGDKIIGGTILAAVVAAAALGEAPEGKDLPRLP